MSDTIVTIGDAAADKIGQLIAKAVKDNIAKLVGGASDAAAKKGVDLGELSDKIMPTITAIGGLGNISNAAAGSIKTLAGAAIGPQAAQFVQAMEDARLQTNKNFQMGIGNLSLFDQQMQVYKAGFNTQEQYREALQRSGGALGGINNSMSQTSTDILRFGEKVRSRDLNDKDASLLKGNAMLGDELGRVALLSQYGRRDKLSEGEATTRAVDATDKLSREILKQAFVTGKSTVAIEAELEERLQQPVVLANMRQMTEQQRESFISNQVALSGMGKNVSDLSATLGINGRLSEQQRYQLLAMGPAASEFQRASRMVALAKTDEQREIAAEAMRRSQAKVNDYQNSPQFANALKNLAEGDPRRVAMEAQMRQNLTAAPQAAARRDTGFSGVSANQLAGAEAKRVIAGKKLENGKEVDDPNQTAARTMGVISIAAQTNTIGLVGAMDKFSKQMLNNVEVTNVLNTMTKKLYGSYADVNEAEKAHLKTLNDIVKLATPGSGDTGGDGEDKQHSRETDKQKRQRKRKEGQPFASGTKDVFGDWFGGNFGSGELAELHGTEAVVPQSKISEFMKDMMSSMKKPKAQGAESDLPNMPSMTESGTRGGGNGDNVTLKDVLASLQQLNKTMGQVASHSESISEASHKSARLAGKATGNRVAV
jgi:hypothetical protein